MSTDTIYKLATLNFQVYIGFDLFPHGEGAEHFPAPYESNFGQFPVFLLLNFFRNHCIKHNQCFWNKWSLVQIQAMLCCGSDDIQLSDQWFNIVDDQMIPLFLVVWLLENFCLLVQCGDGWYSMFHDAPHSRLHLWFGHEKGHVSCEENLFMKWKGTKTKI